MLFQKNKDSNFLLPKLRTLENQNPLKSSPPPSAMAISSSAAGDPRILSFHDELLRRSDLRILDSSTAFINDRLISFFFAHLHHSLSPSSSILLLPPSVSFFLSIVPDLQTLAALDLPSKTLILFPVNDNPDPSVPEGGNHWSLLVYSRDGNKFVHHDSLMGLNSRSARRLCESVKGFVGGDGENALFVEGWSPTQRNYCDCGLFVMAVARAICEWKEKRGRGEDWTEHLKEEVDVERVWRLRQELGDLIRRLMMKEQK